MARKAPKMTDLIIEETSGVDHPAHLHEGWLVVKASGVSSVADVMRDLPQSLGDGMTEDATDTIMEPVLNEASEEEAKQEYYDEQEKDELAIAEARIVELEARIAELESARNMDEVEESAEDDVVALAKAAPEPLRKAFEDMQKAKIEAEITLAKEREDRADADAIVKARDMFKHLSLDAEKVGPALRRLSVMDGELAKSIEEALVSANAQNESADIFTEVGKGFVPKGDAIEKMTSLAKAAVAEGKAATEAQALAQVAVDNPALYTEYLNEKGA